jgi:FeS assembly protein IscX
MPLFWEDAEDIAEALLEAHPDEDPTELTLPTLDRMICDLPDFADDPGRSSGGRLEAIQKVWAERVKG